MFRQFQCSATALRSPERLRMNRQQINPAISIVVSQDFEGAEHTCSSLCSSLNALRRSHRSVHTSLFSSSAAAEPAAAAVVLALPVLGFIAPAGRVIPPAGYPGLAATTNKNDVGRNSLVLSRARHRDQRKSLFLR